MPKSTWVPLGLLGGLVLIFIANPPYTVCNSQEEEFQKQHTPFFLFEASARFKEKTGYEKAFESCQNSNNPGGCVALFNGVNELVDSLKTIPGDCALSFCKKKEFNEALWETLDILVRIAWGDQPPSDIYEKTSWLNHSHFSLFCQIKQTLIDCHGEKRWKKVQEETLNSLPGIEGMDRRDIWRLTLLSTDCSRL